jgi:hypothetical protein
MLNLTKYKLCLLFHKLKKSKANCKIIVTYIEITPSDINAFNLAAVRKSPINEYIRDNEP